MIYDRCLPNMELSQVMEACDTVEAERAVGRDAEDAQVVSVGSSKAGVPDGSVGLS